MDTIIENGRDNYSKTITVREKTFCNINRSSAIAMALNCIILYTRVRNFITFTRRPFHALTAL